MIRRLTDESPGDFEDPLKNYTPRVYSDPLEKTLAEATISAIQSRPFTTVATDSPVDLVL